MKLSRKTLIIALLLAFAIGGVAANEESAPPKPDRPALKWISRIARLGLWFVALGEPAPVQAVQHIHKSDSEIDHYRSL
jgi:hypothetical protein